jgi:hypothetical protein
VRRVWDSAHLRLAGLHLHLRADMDNPAWYTEACQALADFLRSWPFQRVAALEYMDMGSGFPSHMSKLDTRVHWNPRPIDEYIVAIAQGLRRCFDGTPAPRLILEPGRYLVNDAIIFVSRIVSVRDRAGTQQIVCNGATTMVPSTASRPDHSEPPTGPDSARGPSSREHLWCIVPRGRRAVSAVRRPTGDYLAHFGVGAYIRASIRRSSSCPILRSSSRPHRIAKNRAPMVVAEADLAGFFRPRGSGWFSGSGKTLLSTALSRHLGWNWSA